MFPPSPTAADVPVPTTTETPNFIRRFVCAAVHGVSKGAVSRGTRAPGSTSMVAAQSGVVGGQLGREAPRLHAELKRRSIDSDRLARCWKMKGALGRAEAIAMARIEGGRWICWSREAPEVVRFKSCDDRRYLPDVPAEILRVSSDGGADWRRKLRREEAGQAKPTNWPPLNLGRLIWQHGFFADMLH